MRRSENKALLTRTDELFVGTTERWRRWRRGSRSARTQATSICPSSGRSLHTLHSPCCGYQAGSVAIDVSVYLILLSDISNLLTKRSDAQSSSRSIDRTAGIVNFAFSVAQVRRVPADQAVRAGEHPPGEGGGAVQPGGAAEPDRAADGARQRRRRQGGRQAVPGLSLIWNFLGPSTLWFLRMPCIAVEGRCSALLAPLRLPQPSTIPSVKSLWRLHAYQGSGHNEHFTLVLSFGHLLTDIQFTAAAGGVRHVRLPA